MADKQTKLLAEQLKKRKASLESVERGIVISLERAVNTIFKDIDFKNDSTVDALATLSGLEASMAEAGLSKLFEEIEDIYGDELLFIQKSLKLSGLETLTDLDKEAISVIVEADLDNLTRNFENFAGDIKQSLVRNVLANETPELSDALRITTGRTARNVVTEFDTALSGIDRSITIKKAQDAFGLGARFIYLGADDKLTRPFCKENLGKVFTLAQIKKLDNEQGLDPFIYCGGFNCRHVWRAIDGN